MDNASSVNQIHISSKEVVLINVFRAIFRFIITTLVSSVLDMHAQNALGRAL
jgi:hypothetical protein